VYGPALLGGAFLCHEIAVIGGRIWSSAGAQPGYRGQIMRGMTRKAKARVELAKLVVASARERAAVAAQRYAAHMARPMRAPSVRQRRRWAELQKNYV
jgi:hypothetical protein